MLLTHALPLIFRGKSFIAIGDPELSSIPSLQQEEENAIVIK